MTGGSVRNQGRVEDFNAEENSIVQEIDNFAGQGFRTLMFASKELFSEEIDGVLT